MRIPVPFGPISLAVDEGAVWAAGQRGQVARIDPRTNVVTLIASGNGYGGNQIAAGLGAVWVLNPLLGTVTRIDPSRNVVAATIDVGRSATAMAVGEGWVWVTVAKDP